MILIVQVMLTMLNCRYIYWCARVLFCFCFFSTQSLILILLMHYFEKCFKMIFMSSKTIIEAGVIVLYPKYKNSFYRTSGYLFIFCGNVICTCIDSFTEVTLYFVMSEKERSRMESLKFLRWIERESFIFDTEYQLAILISYSPQWLDLSNSRQSASSFQFWRCVSGVGSSTNHKLHCKLSEQAWLCFRGQVSSDINVGDTTLWQ